MDHTHRRSGHAPWLHLALPVDWCIHTLPADRNNQVSKRERGVVYCVMSVYMCVSLSYMVKDLEAYSRYTVGVATRTRGPLGVFSDQTIRTQGDGRCGSSCGCS